MCTHKVYFLVENSIHIMYALLNNLYANKIQYCFFFKRVFSPSQKFHRLQMVQGLVEEPWLAVVVEVGEVPLDNLKNKSIIVGLQSFKLHTYINSPNTTFSDIVSNFIQCSYCEKIWDIGKRENVTKIDQPI